MTKFDERNHPRRRFWEANTFRTLLMMLAVLGFAVGFLTIGFAAGTLTARIEGGLLQRCVVASERAMIGVLWADSISHERIEAHPGLEVEHLVGAGG